MVKTQKSERCTSEDAEPPPELRAASVVRYKPNSRECALLLLALAKAKGDESGREFSRLRVSEISLRRLWCRSRISPEFVDDVDEWLSSAGMTLFYAGGTYAVIRSSVVGGWPRVSSKLLSGDLSKIAQGNYDFSSLEHLLSATGDSEADDEA